MSSCCDEGCEEEINELYLAYMKKMSRLPRLHPQRCNDKCGCYARTCTCAHAHNKNSYLNVSLKTA